LRDPDGSLAVLNAKQSVAKIDSSFMEYRKQILPVVRKSLNAIKSSEKLVSALNGN
jgi:hypothetical protein